MATNRGDGLPFLPGNSFKNPTEMKYHVSNTLTLKNGFLHQKRPVMGLGGKRLEYNQLSENEINELAQQMPTLTYGQAKQMPPESFVPAHVAFDKKVLRYFAYFKETVHESSQEFYRVRMVHIYYYLEDDSIAVVEPDVQNSGIPQGKLIRRQRLPKDDQGNHWHWRDINNGVDLVFYGRSFHVIDCDKFTKDFIESEGLYVNEPEASPPDPYTEKRRDPRRTYVTKSDFDQLKRFLTLDRQVLRFYCVWDDRDSMYGQMLPFIIHYFLVNDTVEVLEVHRPNDGRDPFPVLMRRQKLPKSIKNVDPSFPSIVMELSEHEICDWFTDEDFGIGKTVSFYGRRFLIYDCDEFTKNYLRRTRGESNFTPIPVEGFAKEVPNMELPPYNGYGSLEDSRQNCLTLTPHPPRKDYIKMLENLNKVLRYEARLESKRPEDEGRRFIISFKLSDDTISIFEPHQRNSGIIGGKFLEATRIPKPGSDPEFPEYYGPADLAIGSMIKVFQHRFILTGCDEFVWKMLPHIEDGVPEATVESIRKLHG